jgi:hypothetical protein
MSARQQTDALVADFLARGGRIRKVPEAQPTKVADVLSYLRERGAPVEPVAPKAKGETTMYLYQGELVNLRTLVDVANRYRRRHGLAAFELAGCEAKNGTPVTDQFDGDQIPELETADEPLHDTDLSEFSRTLETAIH